MIRAAQEEVKALRPLIDKITEALGHPDAFVSDESTVHDFLEIFGFKHRQKIDGKWVDKEPDKAAQERNQKLLIDASAKLGVIVSPNDTIVDVARQMRKLGLS